MNTRGALFAGLSAMLYGSSYVATAIALRSFTPLTVAAWRGMLSAVILGAILMLPPLRSRLPWSISRGDLGRLVLMGLLGGAAFTLAMNSAVGISGATVTAFVAGLYAVLAAALAIPLLGERLERSTLAALLAALFGTLLLADLRLDLQTVAGIGLALVAAASFGLYLVLSRGWARSRGLSGAAVGLSSLTMTGVAGLAAVALAGEPILPDAPRADALLAIAWLALGPGVVAAVLVVAGMQLLPARVASVFLLLNPPTAAVLAFLLLGERLSALQLIGGACVLAAMAAATWQRRRG
ncbi:MAG TPA: DMT family transporter [Candidatus Limnocylindria bacterium]|nr:DMT family transporter [Candidatus Limnocylindria bacterium]